MSDRRPPSLSMTILLPLAVVPLVTGCDSQAPPTAADDPSGPSTGTVGAAVRPGGLAAVFDRSTESGSVYLVEPDGGNRKGSSDATRPDFLLLYPAYDPAYEAPTLPLSPPEVSDDCGALENVEAIEDYLESAAQLADGAVGSVEACAEQVRALAEEVLGLIADANDSGPGTLADLCSLGTGPTAITPSNPVGRADGCSRCADQLSNVAKRDRAPGVRRPVRPAPPGSASDSRPRDRRAERGRALP